MSRLMRKRHLLLLPVIITLAALVIYPFLNTIYAGFYRDGSFVGLENYSEIFLQDERFWHSLVITLQYAFVSVGLEFIVGLALALLLNEEFKGRNVFRTILMIPMIISPVVAALIFRHLMYAPELGMLNYFLRAFGSSGLSWISGTHALFSIILIDVWEWSPFIMLILLAGLQSLPEQPFEAAEIDGASCWQIFINITLPLLKLPIVIAILFRLIDAMRTFDIIMGATQGGPGFTTENLNIYTYKQVFKYNNYGYGSSLTIIMFVIIIVISVFLMRVIIGKTVPERQYKG